MTVRKPRHRSRWLGTARVAQTAWFFGNLYEGVVGIPQLLADARPRRSSGLLAAGSPVRYFAPTGPAALGSTALALSRCWRSGADRRVIVANAACVVSAAALSGYLIRTVNARLLASGEPLPEPERHRLVTTWHAVNGIRLAALAGALASLSRVITNDRGPRPE
ncbi:DUF1772 domain-containing protein [Amycolatopsis samaneae]|uniref:DUF1772 domain-containing protein n=1 Tax=Amycolatopsis samaneae TaxID=664691 RepID=A0ABW5GEC5_9PSEU